MFWFYIFLYQWVLPLLLLYAFWPPGRWKVSLETTGACCSHYGYLPTPGKRLLNTRYTTLVCECNSAEQNIWDLRGHSFSFSFFISLSLSKCPSPPPLICSFFLSFSLWHVFTQSLSVASDLSHTSVPHSVWAQSEADMLFNMFTF